MDDLLYVSVQNVWVYYFLCAKLFHEKMQEKLQVCECSETWHT